MDPSPSPRPQTTFRLTSLSADAVRQTAALHAQLLPNGLFPALGQRFLRRWHRTFITSPQATGFVAYDADGTCCGFLIGTLDQGRYTGEVLRRQGFGLALAGAMALMLRPRLATYFLRTRGRRYLRKLTIRRHRLQDAHPHGPITGIAVLHAIATTPAVRGQGVGFALLKRYEQELMAHQVKTMQLVTQASGGACDFYRRAGYVETDRRLNRDGEAILQFDRFLGDGR